MATKPEVADTAKLDAATAGAERVEIKVTVREEEEAKAIKTFGLDVVAAGRSIYFFDTSKLDLYRQGVLLRARQIEGEPDDSTVKIRPIDPQTVDKKWFKSDGFKLEADAVGDKVVRSASLTQRQGKDEIGRVVQGERAISKLYTPDQERFLATFLAGAVDFDGLATMGPIPALRRDYQHPGMTYRVAAEKWHLPDGSDLVELSIKCPREEAAVARKIFEGFLVGLGLDPHGSAETKTKRALSCFAKRLEDD